MILSICMRCAAIYDSKAHGQPGMQFSHGWCPACAPVILAEAVRQAEEINREVPE